LQWLRLRRVPMFVYCPAENRYPGFAESLLGCVRRLGAPPGARRPGRSAQVTIDLLPDRVCLSPLRARTCESIDAGLLDSSATSTHHTELHRPADCPVAKIAEGVGLQPPAQPDAADTRRRFTRVAAAAAILLESGDGRLLLTRRPAGMSAFPEVWVPPGGHLDLGETAAQAAARELAEEVGLTLPAGGAGPPIRLLTAWESVFPASLDIGWPARHHLVLYFHARLSESSASLTSAAKPEPREVDRLVWIDRRLARRIGGTLLLEEGDGLADDGDRQNSREETPDEETVPSWSLDRSEVPVQVSQLLSCRPDAKNRVSTGTKMALLEWLRLTEQDGNC
uniref:Nudix hydrolase domain-containing protein n=1 Tax=Macrostomum lignano TaxID=282301 RepID=A0A1I8IHL8_9PLAT